MSSTRRAVIDIGTNSVKLLVGDVASGHITPIQEKSEQTRLGKGFYQTHRLSPESIRETAEAVADFAEKARRLGADSIRVFATSAARDAENQHQLLEEIQEKSGLSVGVISGDAEAELVFQGVMSDPKFEGKSLLIMDVGGGSSEFILGRGEHKSFSASLPLGTVRLLEMLPHSDPPDPSELEQARASVAAFLEQRLCNQIRPHLNQQPLETVLVGTGGTATILARIDRGLTTYDRAEIERVRLSCARISQYVESLWKLPLAERRTIAGLPPKRADVILTGVVIFEAVMKLLGFAELSVSTRGLRFAALLQDI